MTRRSMHALFAVLALACAGTTLYQAIHLLRLQQVNQAMASVTPASPPTASEATRVTLARALVFSRAGDVERAVKEFSRLINRQPPDPTARIALYDLGNLYLRHGVVLGEQSPVAALPFIELAKQRYRDLLRLDPEQWDARYNLERALRLAPESQAVFNEASRYSEHRSNFQPRDDVQPPDLP